MKPFLSRLVDEFRQLWKHYIYQSLLATLVVFIVLLSLSVEQAVIIASIGATAFIVFAMPGSVTAQPRRVIGGHLVGLLSGSVSAIIPQPTFLYSALIYSLAVGASIFIMVAIDVEHPPAAGTALGVAIRGFSPNVAVAIITSTVMLALAHQLLKPFMKDLT